MKVSQIALRCGKCRKLWMQAEDECQIEFDFHESKITFICPQKDCKHENIMDFKSWQKQQKHSSLPRIGTM
jgi:predicted RNA-binding Zn-ribbon protein involved in translation (DUF1610 family)